MPLAYADSPIRQESCGGWDIQKGQDAEAQERFKKGGLATS